MLLPVVVVWVLGVEKGEVEGVVLSSALRASVGTGDSLKSISLKILRNLSSIVGLCFFAFAFLSLEFFVEATWTGNLSLFQ